MMNLDEIFSVSRTYESDDQLHKNMDTFLNCQRRISPTEHLRVQDSCISCEGTLKTFCELVTVEMAHVSALSAQSLFPQDPRRSLRVVLQCCMAANPVIVSMHVKPPSHVTCTRIISADAKKKRTVGSPSNNKKPVNHRHDNLVLLCHMLIPHFKILRNTKSMQLQHSYFAFHTGDDLHSVQEAHPSDKH